MNFKELKTGTHFEFVCDGSVWKYIKMAGTNALITKSPGDSSGLVTSYSHCLDYPVQGIESNTISLNAICKWIKS